MIKMKWLGLSICIILATAGFSEAKGWRGLIPLHSTRSDVEHLLGASREARGVAFTYETKNERVLVFYSEGKCDPNGWNVPRETVISITVTPYAKLMVEEIKLDKTKYERVLDYHMEGIVYYLSKESGVRISARMIQEGETVDSLTYEPAAEDYNLKCADSSVRLSCPTLSLFRKFDTYSDLNSKDERARLDNFAIYLQKDEPQFNAYIIVYAGQRTRLSAAQARAKRVKDYLVKVRGIEAARIVVLNCGRRDQFGVELYALPSSTSQPY